ncbi:MAG: enoyl-CoA hydratase/isomerase family protein [bacterium]
MPINHLLAEVVGAVGTITLNRLEERNALTPEMLAAIPDILADWSVGDKVRAVIFTGAGDKAFCAGYSIQALPVGDAEAFNAMPFLPAMSAIRHFPYPTIAMMNGGSFGGGLNLAVCCDMRIAADDILVGMPPAKLGVVYMPEGLAHFISVVGMAKTREIFLTAQNYRADEALELGLINRIVPREDLTATVRCLAESMVGNAPLATKGVKRSLNLLDEQLHLDEKHRLEVQQLIDEAAASDDAKEARQAFLDKRPPEFKGR